MRLSIAVPYCAVLGLALTGCASTAPGPASPAANASATPAAKMDYLTALRLVRNWGPITSGGISFLEKAGQPTSNESEVAVTLKSGGVFHCRYADTPNPVVASRMFASPPTSVNLNCRGASLSVWDTEKESQALVAAWKTMLAGAPSDSPEQAAAFEVAAAKYRADPAAHELPEQARAFRVQAEIAVREKRFWDAADRFSKTLAVSPWWAPGRFNLALIYGELELPGLAMAEMKKYLKLAPDATNARAAQDKIYEWQDKAGR